MSSIALQSAAIAAYLKACELELQAFKPGNVSQYSEGHGMTVADFRRSAEASAPCLADMGLPLGERVFRAIDATWAAVGCNTNLGIVLLAAPLMQAFMDPPPDRSLGFHAAVKEVLQQTTIADADWVYRAIRRARPAGLGAAPEQDVHMTPNVTLLQTMALAADRDTIARQYTDSFADIFHTAVPMYDARLSQGDNEEWATVAVYASFLSRYPDSHVQRKLGVTASIQVSARMAGVEAALSASGSLNEKLDLLRQLDTEFKAGGINPGTSADLTVATLLAAQLNSRYR